MTNQQGAPEALRLAEEFKLCNEYDSIPSINDIAKAEAELRRLHAENERLAALRAQQPATHVQNLAENGHIAGDVSKNSTESNMTQQPATSAAAPVGEAPLPLLVRDIAADLGTTPIQVCTALAQLGFGGHSVNMAVTPRMAQSLRAHFASRTPQADSPPAPVLDREAAIRAAVAAMPHTNPLVADDLLGGFTMHTEADDVIAIFEAGRAASAPADSVTAPAEVAYLDIGAGGYIDLGTDLSNEALSRLPKGRHVLIIAGTYGIDGYTPTPPAQAADSVLEDAARLDWLEQNIFHRELDEWDSKVGGRGNQNMWVLFAPKGVQGSARKIIDAARKQGANHD